MKKRTPLSIEASVMRALRLEAARRGCTMSELVETALRRMLASRERPAKLPPLPSFNSGGALVDVADSGALHDAMEGR